jgi:hypothetical protein
LHIVTIFYDLQVKPYGHRAVLSVKEHGHLAVKIKCLLNTILEIWDQSPVGCRPIKALSSDSFGLQIQVRLAMFRNAINVIICDRCGQYHDIPHDIYQRTSQLQFWVRWGEQILCPQCAAQVEQNEREGRACA